MSHEIIVIMPGRLREQGALRVSHDGTHSKTVSQLSYVTTVTVPFYPVPTR